MGTRTIKKSFPTFERPLSIICKKRWHLFSLASNRTIWISRWDLWEFQFNVTEGFYSVLPKQRKICHWKLWVTVVGVFKSSGDATGVSHISVLLKQWLSLNWVIIAILFTSFFTLSFEIHDRKCKLFFFSRLFRFINIKLDDLQGFC